MPGTSGVSACRRFQRKHPTHERPALTRRAFFFARFQLTTRSDKAMCSIFGMFGLTAGDDLIALRTQAMELSQRQRHRGPDWSGVYVDDGAILVHERLALVHPASGGQAPRSPRGGLALAVNGEIYNHRELRAASDYAFTTGSDCEVINALYREHGAASLGWLNGVFAFAWWDPGKRRGVIARDPVGVCPLSWGHDREGRLCVASEMKSL